jgi:hypothetical protein
MPVSVRRRVLEALWDGTVDRASPLTDVPYIGPYLERRLRHSLSFSADTALTVGVLWNRTRRRTTAGTVNLLKRALQNERSNQCVSSRVFGERWRTRYHTGDVNERGYEAVAALLEFNRTNARYGTLPPHLPSRSPESRSCGCRPMRECRGSCRRSDDGRACVPTSPDARGFVGVTAHQSQRENVGAAARVRRASRTRETNALTRDPDSVRDVARGHRMELTYDRRGSRLWRRPSTRVRSNR